MNFDFNINKIEIAKIYDRNKSETIITRQKSPEKKRKIKLEPNGKYYPILLKYIMFIGDFSGHY